MNKGTRRRHQKPLRQTSELFLKGQQLLGAGQTHQAGAVLRKVLKVDPRHAEAAHLLGILACQSNNLVAGIKYITQAISADPDQPAYYNNVGQAYKSSGQTKQAVESFRRAVEINPDYAEAQYNLAAAFHELEQLDAAAHHYRIALSLRPGDALAHYNLGIALKSSGQFEPALESFDKALALRSNYPGAIIAKGNTLKELGQIDGALGCFKNAISLQPDFVEAYLNLGNLEESLGRKKDALSCYIRAISIDPEYAEARHAMALARKHLDADEENITSMERLISSSDLNTEKRIHLAFGLGKAFDDLRQYDKAFDYFAIGNLEKRNSVTYSLDTDKIRYQNLKNLFTPAFFKQFETSGIDDPTPIFILGMPRSGTTLVEQILASHSDVHGAGELKHLHYIADRFQAESLALATTSGTEAVAFSDLTRLGNLYVQEIRRYSSDARFITDKMPDNFLNIGLIRLALPNAKIIHCRRNPMDTCLSIFKLHLPYWHDYAYDQTEIGQNYNLYRDLIAHWHRVLPGFIYDIQYEDVVSDQLEQTKRLLEYCGLEWNDACLDFHKSDRPVSTASSGQVRRPLYSDSVQAWKHYEAQLEPLRRVLED